MASSPTSSPGLKAGVSTATRSPGPFSTTVSVSVWARNDAPTFARDLNGDGDFADGGEITTLGAVAATHCDVEGEGPLTVGHDGGGLQLLTDDNDDGDFADTGEEITVPSDGSIGALELARDDVGRVWIATEDQILVDPGALGP